MAGGADVQVLNWGGQARIPWTRLAVTIAFSFLALPSPQLSAQQSTITVIAPGEAAVTGFAGAPLPAQIAPSTRADPR